MFEKESQPRLAPNLLHSQGWTFIYTLCVCVHVCMSQHACGGQRTTLETRWVLGMKLRSASALTHKQSFTLTLSFHPPCWDYRRAPRSLVSGVVGIESRASRCQANTLPHELHPHLCFNFETVSSLCSPGRPQICSDPSASVSPNAGITGMYHTLLG